MSPILATCLILAVFLGPLIFCAVMIALAGRAEKKRLNEQADYILRAGCLPRPVALKEQKQ